MPIRAVWNAKFGGSSSTDGRANQVGGTWIMRRLLVGALLVMVVGAGSLFAQQPGEGSITRLDPALDAIVPPNTKLEMLVDDYFGSSEGPVWIKNGSSGHLLFSDQAANRIYKWDGKL